MQQEARLRLSEVFVTVEDPHQPGKVGHDLMELLVAAVSAVISGADTFAEIVEWGQEKLPWLRQHLRLSHGIASHNTFARVFGLIDPQQFEAAFRRWVSSVMPVLGKHWHAWIGEPAMADAMLDRMLPRAHRIVLKGESLRSPERPGGGLPIA